MQQAPGNPYDVAIIGGGLAGLCLAIQLAEKQVRTVVFEKEKYPFHKVCGEYISMESRPFMERLGLPLGSHDLPGITRLKISSQKGTTLSHRLRPGGFGISRYLLDSMLAALARERGVTLLEGTRVSSFSEVKKGFDILAGGTVFNAGLLVGAHGKRSNIDRHLDRKFMRNPLPSDTAYMAVKYHVKADLPPDTIELHNFRNGYCGVSRVEDDKYCLCYLTRADSLKASGSIAEMERQVLMQNPYLERYLSSFRKSVSSPVTISQVSFQRKKAVEGNVLMAGDSAGLIAPLCGNGMSMAMHASGILAELIAVHLGGRITRDQLYREYSTRWSRLFGARITAGIVLQGLMGKEKLTDITLRLLNRSPRLTSYLIGLTHGKEF